MDFGKLLHKAQKNEVTKKEPIRYYSTKFEPPKKEKREKSQVSINVKKFLERKEHEEQQKRLEAQKKKEELLALRAKDKKAVKRVSVMLKRTKSANQSVIQDAVDTDNTAVTLAGPAQPDEDDYGYVSQEASAFYNKMMEKYNKMPDEPKFKLEKKKVSTNLSTTKDRVKAALEREKEEAMMPHKRKRKHKNPEEADSGCAIDDNQDKYKEEKPEPSKQMKIDKPKPKMPPPINFADLLKLAEKKQFEPIVIEKKPKVDENPLTKKQKKEMERVREWQEKKNERNKQPPTNIQRPEPMQSSTNSKEKMSEKPGIIKKKTNDSPKLAEALTRDEKKQNQPGKTNKQPEEIEADVNPRKIDWGPKHPSYRKPNGPGSSLSNHPKPIPSVSSSKPDIAKKKSDVQYPPSSNQPQKSLPPSKSNEAINIKRDNTENRQISISKTQKENKYRTIEERSTQALKHRQQLMSSQGTMKPKQFPPIDLKPRMFPPADVRRKNSNGKMQMNKRRIMDDDDEDEDSEMDDFIDDGPEEDEDYSKHISEIFGYNKSKYTEIDEEDDDNMESSFAQQMKEEVISTKLGIMEDLEDMKMEEKHKREKALMKKKMAKRK